MYAVGNIELFNMEDIIPLLIFIIIQSGIPNIKNELDFMVDFIGFDPCDLESERRLLVNMSVHVSSFRNPSTTFQGTGKYSDTLSTQLIVILLRILLINQSRILSRGSFALSSVNLYLFSLTLASNYFLYSGLVNSRPITHYEAETLYFLALLSKMISSCSGSIIWSTRLKILTTIIFILLAEGDEIT